MKHNHSNEKQVLCIMCFSMIFRRQSLLLSEFSFPSLLIAHGTFIGSLRLESHKPTQLPIDSTFHFGASTRYYIIRERPQTGARPIIEELEKTSEEAEGGLLGLPETETELDVS
jgi:hypothetical protein